MSESMELPNAERKLNGAKFYLKKLEESRDKPQDIYHHLSSILEDLVSVRNSLINEFGEDQWRPWLENWRKNLNPQDRKLADSMVGYRIRDVHGKGLPLKITIPILGQAYSGTVTIDLKKGVVLLRATTTSVVEKEITRFKDSVSSERMMQSDPLTHDVYGNGIGKIKEIYTFDDIHINHDVIDMCKKAIVTVERLLNDARSPISGLIQIK
jgi:hypothetical protein